jgi:hypothetical protein
MESGRKGYLLLVSFVLIGMSQQPDSQS